MARTLGRLSAVKVQGIKTPGYYADGGNLYLRVADGGTKNKSGVKGWIFRYATYASQRETVHDRAFRRARKLCHRLGGDLADDRYRTNRSERGGRRTAG